MKSFLTTLMLVALVGTLCSTSYAATQKQTPYVITDDDNGGVANTATVYTISGSTLTLKTAVSTGGQGLGGGYFANNRATVAHSLKYGQCVYVSDNGTNDIAGIDLSTLTVTGNFKGSGSDSADGLGIGLTAKTNYLYASFPGSATIGWFTEQPGCKLTFKGDVSASGLNGGAIDGMKAHFGILAVAYADGSIQSFNVSHGVPVANKDLQLSTGSGQYGCVPTGVDVTADAKYAVFADACAGSVIEVSAITPAGLSPTVAYAVGTGANSNNVWLSPDQSIIYVTNNASGQLTGALFDKTTGLVGASCTSPVFKNFGSSYFYASGSSTKNTSGNGGQVYVAETGGSQGFNAVAIVDVTTGGGSCSLVEDSSSPATDPNATGFMLSLATNTRKF